MSTRTATQDLELAASSEPRPEAPELVRARTHWAALYAAGSLRVLCSQLTTRLESGQRADQPACANLEQAHVQRYGRAALDAELADERARDAALGSELELVRYQRQWDVRVARMMRAYPARWHVPGLSSEETRDTLTLRLIEALHEDKAARAVYERPGKPWALCVMQQELARLRNAFRLAAAPTDFQTSMSVLDHRVGVEEQCLQQESEWCFEQARHTAEGSLNVSQRRWLSAMKLAARGGEFFASSSELNLSAVSRVLGKNRSSAVRAYRELQIRFQRELQRLE